MQGLDWHVTRAYGVAEPCEEAQVFKMGGKARVAVFVETQQELDLVEALQYLHGGQINLKLWDRDDITQLRYDYWLIYTTWDPFDPNRI